MLLCCQGTFWQPSYKSASLSSNTRQHHQLRHGTTPMGDEGRLYVCQRTEMPRRKDFLWTRSNEMKKYIRYLSLAAGIMTLAFCMTTGDSHPSYLHALDNLAARAN